MVNSYQLNPSAYPETSPPPPEPVFVSFHTAEPGDYTITITTVDGSHTATLNVKIQPLEPANVPVESISVSKSEVEIDTNIEGGN